VAFLFLFKYRWYYRYLVRWFSSYEYYIRTSSWTLKTVYTKRFYSIL